ncbi:MAG: outer membrane protein assembly factor BamB [Limisphaerales bacterium]|jgi:outer membrane protein assembly factor BamB
MKMKKAMLAALALSISLSAVAENWPQWRGPHHNGSSTERNLPDDFSKTKNVVWSTEMPGLAAATPIIWGDHVFISTTDEKAGTLNAAALDRKTGEILWNHIIAKGVSQDRKSNYASNSPVTDGQVAIYFYGNGDLVAYDFSGKKVWDRNIQKDYGDFAFGWTFSTSPILFEGTLYLQVLQRNEPASGRGAVGAESYLLAMNPKTGKTKWKHVRPSTAKLESLEAFTTPVPFEHNGRKEIVIVGGDCLTGHDPKTGKELWRWGNWNPRREPYWRLVPSPGIGGGVVLASAPKGGSIYAVKAGLSGTQNDSALAWTSNPRELTADVCTPTFSDGDFFIIADKLRDETLSRVDPKTGKVKWTLTLPDHRKLWRASPTVADGKVYCVDHAANVSIVSAKSGKLIREVAMGRDGDNNTRSTIVVSQGQLFIRNNWKLFCIGKNARVARSK